MRLLKVLLLVFVLSSVDWLHGAAESCTSVADDSVEVTKLQNARGSCESKLAKAEGVESVHEWPITHQEDATNVASSCEYRPSERILSGSCTLYDSSAGKFASLFSTNVQVSLSNFLRATYTYTSIAITNEGDSEICIEVLSDPVNSTNTALKVAGGLVKSLSQGFSLFKSPTCIASKANETILIPTFGAHWPFLQSHVVVARPSGGSILSVLTKVVASDSKETPPCKVSMKVTEESWLLLFAAAAVCCSVILMFSWRIASIRSFQISIGTLIGTVTILIIFLLVFGKQLPRVAKGAMSIAAIALPAAVPWNTLGARLLSGELSPIFPFIFIFAILFAAIFTVRNFPNDNQTRETVFILIQIAVRVVALCFCASLVPGLCLTELLLWSLYISFYYRGWTYRFTRGKAPEVVHQGLQSSAEGHIPASFSREGHTVQNRMKVDVDYAFSHHQNNRGLYNAVLRQKYPHMGDRCVVHGVDDFISEAEMVRRSSVATKLGMQELLLSVKKERSLLYRLSVEARQKLQRLMSLEAEREEFEHDIKNEYMSDDKGGRHFDGNALKGFKRSETVFPATPLAEKKRPLVKLF